MWSSLRNPTTALLMHDLITRVRSGLGPKRRLSETVLRCGWVAVCTYPISIVESSLSRAATCCGQWRKTCSRHASGFPVSMVLFRTARQRPIFTFKIIHNLKTLKHVETASFVLNICSCKLTRNLSITAHSFQSASWHKRCKSLRKTDVLITTPNLAFAPFWTCLRDKCQTEIKFSRR